MADQEKRREPTLWQVITSVLAAAFGVQTQQARERDFQHGKPAVFIIGGVVFTLLFVVVLVLVVRMILRAAGV